MPRVSRSPFCENVSHENASQDTRLAHGSHMPATCAILQRLLMRGQRIQDFFSLHQ
jgi:hypothetical protein